MTTSMPVPVRCATGVAFRPLHVDAVSFDPGDLGVTDASRFFAVQQN